MKKIGIITVYGENNYGNKLQNFALIKIYSKFNLNCTTLRTYQSSMVLSKKEIIKNHLKKVLSHTKKYSYFKYQFIRENNFKNFSKKYLNISKKKYDTSSINDDTLEQFDYLSVGSDQVWNDADFNLKDVEYFTLKNIFSPKKIAFAASIGKNSFNDVFSAEFKENIQKFDIITCREQSAIPYLENLINKKCYHFIDPTLMLTKDEWISIEKKPLWLDEKPYNLLYFIGGHNEIVNNNECIDIDVLDKKNVSFTTSPEEFIYLIHNAKLIYTDSFHVCALSLILKKKIIIQERKIQKSKMNSRIEDLFKLFNLEFKFDKVYDFSKIDTEQIIMQEKNMIVKMLKDYFK